MSQDLPFDMHTNYFESPKTLEEESHFQSRSQLDVIVLLGSISVAVALAAAHWFWLQDVHRGGLFQIFGNFLFGTTAPCILAAALFGKFSRGIGVVSTLLVGGTAGYCLLHALGLMMSI